MHFKATQEKQPIHAAHSDSLVCYILVTVSADTAGHPFPSLPFPSLPSPPLYLLLRTSAHQASIGR